MKNKGAEDNQGTCRAEVGRYALAQSENGDKRTCQRSHQTDLAEVNRAGEPLQDGDRELI